MRGAHAGSARRNGLGRSMSQVAGEMCRHGAAVDHRAGGTATRSRGACAGHGARRHIRGVAPHARVRSLDAVHESGPPASGRAAHRRSGRARGCPPRRLGRRRHSVDRARAVARDRLGAASRPRPVPRRSVRRGGPAIVHTTTAVDARHVTTVPGIPVVTPIRALFDVAGSLQPAKLERALDNAWSRRLTTSALLRRTLDELGRRGRPGIAVPRELAEARPPDHRAPESNSEAAGQRRVAPRWLSPAATPGRRRQPDQLGRAVRPARRHAAARRRGAARALPRQPARSGLTGPAARR